MNQEIAAAALLPLLDDPGSLCLIDVRSPEEFHEWAIPGAINIPIEELDSRRDEIVSGLIALICAAGPRSVRGVEILARAGIDAVMVKGGMAAWGHVYDTASLTLGGVTIVQLRRRGKGCLSYVVGAEGSCVVIDPPMDIEYVAEIARDYEWQITHVADTHLHADHVSGARLLAETTGAMLVLNSEDGYSFPSDASIAASSIDLAGSLALSIERVATPGHTMGSATFALGDMALFTGDTLFLESVGRPDLADSAEEFAEKLYDSLHTELLMRSDSTLIFPAHIGQDVPISCGTIVTATLGQLKESLEALSMSRERFIEFAAGRATPRPPNYQAIVASNQAGAVLSFEEISELEAGPNRCAVATAIAS